MASTVTESSYRSKYSSNDLSVTPQYNYIKRSPSVSEGRGNSFKSYNNAIAEYTATVNRLRCRRNSTQEASTARRDSGLRASSVTPTDRIDISSSSTIGSPTVRRPSYSSASYVSPNLRITSSASDYVPRSRSSLSSSSASSSAYADRIISRVDKLLAKHYTSASDAENEEVSSSGSAREKFGKKDLTDSGGGGGGYRRGSYLKALAAADSSPSCSAAATSDYASKYATLPNSSSRKTYSREESLEKAREILAANTGRPKASDDLDDSSSSASYPSRRSTTLVSSSTTNKDYDSGVESFASSRAASFERSRLSGTGYTNPYKKDSSNNEAHNTRTGSRPSTREPSPTRTSITKETNIGFVNGGKDKEEVGNEMQRHYYNSNGSTTSRWSRDLQVPTSAEKEHEISSSGYRSRLENLSRTAANRRDSEQNGQEQRIKGRGENGGGVVDGNEGGSEPEEDWRARGTRGRSPSLRTGGTGGTRLMQPSRKTVAVDETDSAGLVGLKNIGNTCFMNSVLQCLSNTRSLRDYCTSGHYELELNASSSHRDGPLIAAFATVLEALWKKHSSYSSSNAYDPDRFHRKIQQYAPRFSGYLQQDAQEFLRYLLEGLHEDVNRVTVRPKPELTDISDHLDDNQKSAEAWKRYLKRDNSKIVELYVGQLKSSLICDNCGNCSVTFDPFWDLALPIPGNRSSAFSDSNIFDCMKFFTKKEVLDGDERPTCSKCKSRQRSTKIFSIQKFPRCLVIHLKRFSQERYRAKISSLVDYPVEGLDLAPYAADSYTGPRPEYNLFAVSCHAGSTHCGHYTAFCKHPVSGKWNEYNDSRVSSVSSRDVVTSDAYVLFYELIG
ncbi:Ubiquitin carboxyl-terminal hydrolase 2 [Hypsibius exemplaris]|uniref:Ubiquitin carboxyl-terminal hydrolase n=1 Tax=Hypsibius exemplaris TaxID=2072580 RepID=A0A1W0X0T1_HYPEX|nr:Ubiquitin carboxyl-terminal hydrolase 2 [Hypsibius exemplaris]